MAPRPKHTSRSRRRSRRAVERALADPQLITDEQEAAFALIAAASGSTSLPLSDQGDSWDAGAAAKGLSDAQLPNAFFWKDPDGDPAAKSTYKLGFAENRSGTLTAVWRGVTAAAGAVQGARGGVQIPSGDVAGVKAKIGAYYTKAAKQYDDDNIKPPWAASSAVEAAFLLAYSECRDVSFELPDTDLPYEHDVDGVTVYALTDGDLASFVERFEFWAEELDVELASRPGRRGGDIEDEYGGKPSEGTDKDKRLKANRPGASSEREALEAARMALAEDAAPVTDPDPFNTEVVLTALDGQFGNVEGFADVRDRIRVVLEAFEVIDAPVVEELPAPNGPQPVVTPPADGGPSGELRWVANIVPEATLTDDGRAMAPGSLSWRELPLSLMAMVETSEGGHVGAEVAGRIDDIYRDGNMLKAAGVFDSGEYGQRIGQLVGDGTLRGVSVDLAIHQYEVGPKSDYFDDDGQWLAERPEKAEDEEPPSLLDLLFGDDSEDAIFVVTEGVIGAVTVCPFQAFADATIALAASGVPAVWTVRQQAAYVVTAHEVPGGFVELATSWAEKALIASAVEAGLAPVAPPAAWFDNPELTELTPITVDEEGRVFGHAAPWDTCHLGIPGVCTTAPESETNYAYFLLKEVLCEDGERVPCGTITLGTGHADKAMGRGDATAHYDDTGFAAADVNVGEDEFGIWVAGALRPDLSAERAREMRGAVLSGDWRSVNGNLELVALLAVNVPGFPVPRARALVAAGDDGVNEVLALVAAGIHVGHVEATDEIGLAQLSPIQQEKIRVFEAIASGRVAALAARAEGVVSSDELREASAFTAEPEAPEEPAEEPAEAPTEEAPAAEDDEGAAA